MGKKKRQRLAFRALAKEYGVTEEYAKWAYDTSDKVMKNVIIHMGKHSQRKARQK